MEELSGTERDELHQRLLTLQAELRQLLDSSRQSSRPVGLEEPIGRLSRMDALQQQAMAQANRQGHERRLALVEAALVALRQDRYGECRRCEEPIGVGRLRARPETPLCRDCQSAVEGEG